MPKLKKGDDVIIITGKDKGKRGAILSVPDQSRVLVQGINLVKKHMKPDPSKGVVGGIVAREMPIHRSNVAIYNFILKKADRVGFKIDGEQKKIRIFRSNGELVET